MSVRRLQVSLLASKTCGVCCGHLFGPHLQAHPAGHDPPSLASSALTDCLLLCGFISRAGVLLCSCTGWTSRVFLMSSCCQ